MRIVVLKELASGERRVAIVPETVRQFVRQEFVVSVEAGAGEGAFFTDDAYVEAGATICRDAAEMCRQADVVIKINPPTTGSDGRDEIALLPEGVVLVAMLGPGENPKLAEVLAQKGVKGFAVDTIPRITRAQSMDVLSSMATITGYKAVLLAADALARMTPMLMTPAGTIKPASALVIGAGVAGLQAIATAKRLGARVSGVDVRPAVAEQIKSLGAKFVHMEATHQAEDASGYATDLGEQFYKQEQDILAPHVAAADMVITTALIPGRPAPVLITEQMVNTMKGGSVIVDLAARAGGNCTLSQADRTVTHNGVTILAPLNLPSTLPINASEMYSRNMAAFVKEFIVQGRVNIDMNNEVVAGTLVTCDGKVVHQAALEALRRSETS